MSSTKRRSTVHDLASLRLHPDGSKVSNSGSNVELKKSRHTTKDTRGNWIAHDAAGFNRVKTRRSANKDARSQPEEEIGEDEGEFDEAAPGPSDVARGKQKAVEANDDEEDGSYSPKDTRARKRKAFADDFTFLGSSTNATLASLPSSGVAESTEQNTFDSSLLPPPSSDLLKCVHYFASNYYTEMGQLRDSGREYRDDKKRRKIQKDRQKKNSAASSSRRSTEDRDSQQGRSTPSSSDDDEAQSQQEDRAHKHKTKGHNFRLAKRKSCKVEETSGTADMYKVCDGSALMAIGMLLQQHVVDLLSPRIPEGWEDSMIEHGEIPVAVNEPGTPARSPQPDDDEAEAISSDKSEDETENDTLMTNIDQGRGDEAYVPL